MVPILWRTSFLTERRTVASAQSHTARISRITIHHGRTQPGGNGAAQLVSLYRKLLQTIIVVGQCSEFHWNGATQLIVREPHLFQSG